MSSLLLKEYYMMRWFVVFYGVLLSVFLMGQSNLVAASSFYVTLLVWSAMYYDDKNNSEMLLNSLPIRRTEVVLSKYLWNVLSIVAMMGIGAMGCLAICYYDSVECSIDLFQMYLGSGIGVSVALPINFWLNSKYKLAGFVMIIFQAVIVFGILNTGILNLTGLAIKVFLSILPIIMLAISYLISVCIYKRKEF